MDKQILFFDGVCNLCNGFVDFLVSRDKERRLRYAPLQGKTARDLLGDARTRELSTVVLWRDGAVSERSDAALNAIAELGGIWILARALKGLPRFFRDRAYDFVARNRYKMFGKRDTCRLPTPEERALFLD